MKIENPFSSCYHLLTAINFLSPILCTFDTVVGLYKQTRYSHHHRHHNSIHFVIYMIRLTSFCGTQNPMHFNYSLITAKDLACGLEPHERFVFAFYLTHEIDYICWFMFGLYFYIGYIHFTFQFYFILCRAFCFFFFRISQIYSCLSNSVIFYTQPFPVV